MNDRLLACPAAMATLQASGVNCVERHPGTATFDLHRVAPADLFAQSVRLATEVHLYQMRKVSGHSYVSHALLAAGMTVQAGGTVRAACIAVLHDVIEEGGAEALRELQHRFPASIVDAVQAMTPNPEKKNMPYEQRKKINIEHMRSAAQEDTDVAMAYAAEKCATLWELKQDFSLLGPDQVMKSLRRSGHQIMWYYQQVENVLTRYVSGPMANTLTLHVNMVRERLEVQGTFEH
jgi:(p)ppGpp synthase/HD superfamily hydrolase